MLRRCLEDTGRVTVVGVAADGASCLQLAETTSHDALFLDIDLPEINGIEVAELALQSDHPPLIVFVTGHSEYAVKAFELAALDFLLKPYTLPRLHETVDRIASALEQKSISAEALREAILRLAQKEHPTSGRLAVKDHEDGSVRLLDTHAVLCVIYQDRHAVLKTREREYPTPYTIQYLEERIAPIGFVRVNSGTLVNIAYISHLTPNGDGSYDLYLDQADAPIIPVSRNRSKQLLEAMKL